MRVIDWFGRDINQRRSNQLGLATCPALQLQLEDHHTFDADHGGDGGDGVGDGVGDGGDYGSFDANDDRKGFSHQVLEKFGADCANMNIGASK